MYAFEYCWPMVKQILRFEHIIINEKIFQANSTIYNNNFCINRLTISVKYV